MGPNERMSIGNMLGEGLECRHWVTYLPGKKSACRADHEWGDTGVLWEGIPHNVEVFRHNVYSGHFIFLGWEKRNDLESFGFWVL